MTFFQPDNRYAANRGPATVVLAVASLVAGLNWIPLRYLMTQGLSGVWAVLFISLVIIVALLPAAAARARSISWARARAGMLTSFLNGGALALYLASLVMTDVVRAITLFALLPVWGAVFGLVLLGERLTIGKTLSIVLCLVGIYLIFGTEHGWPLPRDVGDWLALVSGLLWSYSSLRMYTGPEATPLEQNFFSMLGCAAVSIIALVTLPSADLGQFPEVSGKLAVSVMAYALFMFLPINCAIMWSSKYLAPMRIGLLANIEVVVGIITAAFLAGEKFGWHEAIGSGAVISSAFVDVCWSSSRKRSLPPSL